MLTKTTLRALRDELVQLRRENRWLHVENDRLHVENDRLHVALRREATNPNLSSYGIHELTAGTSAGPHIRS
jgi:regulator of replication initiation timing